MFEIKKFHKDVFVDGNIIFDTDKEVSYLDLVAYSNIRKDQCIEVISADKSLEDNGTIIKYVNNDKICQDDVIYYAAGEISSYGNEIVIENPYRCIYSYNYNIYGMGEVLDRTKDIDDLSTEDTTEYNPYRNCCLSKNIHRLIYLSVFSNYELFMMEILIICYSRFPKVKKMYNSRKRFNGLTEEKVIEKLRSYPYNNFEEVENLFSTLLGIKIPDYKYLKNAYEKRHDIAHRYNISKDGGIIDISKEQLEDHVRNTNKFVYNLFEKVIDVVYQ
ncbi:hypothetical protein [Anaerophaga thermohalophila]|uniref:hypothetical protein n=1 Tax=Anaerophaga thermohalophila TaxID=177400 RepID=UPI000237CDD8|nr:hypothetical protein [Anaerophaga thermohalophila]